MAGLQPDIALLPVSGTYVMTAAEAAEAAKAIKPKIAIPMHYGAIVGTEKDAAVRKFRLLSAIPTLRVRDVSLTDSVELALRLGITLYDAVYVWLSTAENVGLITADRDLCNKARNVARVVHISEL
jgi:predicted nucleic acid-binding protein